MEDNSFVSQHSEWNSLHSFELGVVRDELEDSAAALLFADDLNYGLHHSDLAGNPEHVTTGPLSDTDACQTDAPVGGHSVVDPSANEGAVGGQAAEGPVGLASGAMTHHAMSHAEHVAPHSADPNFGPQTTVSGSVFVGQGSECESETMAYRDIPPSFPRGKEVVTTAAQGNVVLATVSVQTLRTTSPQLSLQQP